MIKWCVLFLSLTFIITIFLQSSLSIFFHTHFCRVENWWGWISFFMRLMNVRETTKCHRPKRVHDFVTKNDEIEFLCSHCVHVLWLNTFDEKWQQRMAFIPWFEICLCLHWQWITFPEILLALVCLCLQLSEKHLTISLFFLEIFVKTLTHSSASEWWQQTDKGAKRKIKRGQDLVKLKIGKWTQ